MATGDDMRGGNNQPRFEAEFAALTQQVAGIENDYRDLKLVVVGLDKKIESTNASLASKIDASNLNLAAKIDARAATPWGAIWAALGVMLAGLTTVGWLALQPRDDQISQLRHSAWTETTIRRDQDEKLRDRLTALERQSAYASGFLAAQNQNFRPQR